MKIIVTGALGHIGSKLIRDLPISFPGSKIIMLDNVSTQRFSSLFNLPEEGDYSFHEINIASDDIEILFQGADVVIHLAAITDAAGSFGKADDVESNNYFGTLRVASACLNAGAKFILISSTSVYGKQGGVVSEECPRIELQPQSPYAETKLKEEDLVKELTLKNGLKAVVCRFGTIYGASVGMRFHTAVNKFCWQAVMGVPITVWRTAYEQKRPYLDLGDAIKAIVFLIKNELFAGEVYNILTENLTVKQVVDEIRIHCQDLTINFVDNEIMNQLSYAVSSQKIESQGFQFSGRIGAGISGTIKMLRQANHRCRE